MRGVRESVACMDMVAPVREDVRKIQAQVIVLDCPVRVRVVVVVRMAPAAGVFEFFLDNLAHLVVAKVGVVEDVANGLADDFLGCFLHRNVPFDDIGTVADTINVVNFSGLATPVSYPYYVRIKNSTGFGKGFSLKFSFYNTSFIITLSLHLSSSLSTSFTGQGDTTTTT